MKTQKATTKSQLTQVEREFLAIKQQASADAEVDLFELIHQNAFKVLQARVGNKELLESRFAELCFEIGREVVPTNPLLLVEIACDRPSLIDDEPALLDHFKDSPSPWINRIRTNLAMSLIQGLLDRKYDLDSFEAA